MVTTQIKRVQHPLRFLRKDARTAIYTALFGRQGQKYVSKRANVPALDGSRERPENWEYTRAAEIFSQNKDAAAFIPSETSFLEGHLENLAKFARHQQRNAQ